MSADTTMPGKAADSAVITVPSKSMRQNRKWALVAAYFFLFVFIIFFMFPPYYMIITSFKTDAEISSVETIPFLIQEGVTLEHYEKLLFETRFPTFFLNTTIVTVLVVIISISISVLAAYSLTRLRFFGSGLLATGIFLTYLVPNSLLFIPLFKVLGNLCEGSRAFFTSISEYIAFFEGFEICLLDSKWVLLAVFPTLAGPFCNWMMIGYFSTIPKELDEAAFIDGAGHLQMLFRIFIPVAAPGIIAATIFAFTVSWAGFLYPSAFIYQHDEMILTVGTVTSLI
ncbi:MAG: carbohydrate ABC transporter permease, partial [SAR324 cluster bacterium]|nr:carbohydrate ABC transporter permease [SAR324 cluster bacterium]